MSDDGQLALAEARVEAELWRLLARLLMREADEALAQALLAPGARPVVDALHAEAGAWLEGWDAARQEAAAVEYASLFLVPAKGGLSLRIGRWLPDEEDNVASHLEATLAPLGMEGAVAPGQLPSDHLAVIAALVADLLESPNPDARAQATPLVRALLCSWVADFCRFLDGRATLPLYRLAGALLRQLTAGHGALISGAATPDADNPAPPTEPAAPGTDEPTSA